MKSLPIEKVELNKTLPGDMANTQLNYRSKILKNSVEKIVANEKENKEGKISSNFATDPFKSFIENSIDVIMRFDTNHRHLYVNPAVKNQTGFSPEEFIGKTHSEMGFSKHLVEIWERAIEKVIKSKKLNRIEFELPNHIWIDWLLVPEYSIDGIVQSVIATARDITERKKAEQEIIRLNEELEKRVLERTIQLEETNKKLHKKIAEHKKTEKILADNEHRYRTLFEHSPSEIMVIDQKGNLLDVNHPVNNCHGYTREELIGKNVSLFALPESAHEIEDHIKKLVSGNNLHHIVKNVRKDGKIIFVELNETKFPLTDGSEGILVLANDITAKVKAEDELKASEDLFRMLINSMPDIVCFKDGGGQWLKANEAYLKLFDLEGVDYIGKKDSELAKYSSFHQKAFVFFESSDESSWQKGKLSRVEEVIPKSDGTYHVFDIIKLPLYYQDGRRRGLVVIGRDITERKEAEKELIKAKEDAEKSNRLKTDFLAQMSHEIRSPINIILSFTSLLKEELQGKLSNDLEVSFDSIDNGGKRIIRTIDQILNMAEIQTGSFEINITEIDLSKEILFECIREFQTPSNLKLLKLEFLKEIDHAKILGDAYSLQQIFINLLDNAVKYTPKGKIQIKLYKNLTNEICVDIKDSGIGISQEYLPFLFEPFSQEEGGYTRRFEGNGLGLALVKKYTEMNGAKIIVNSEKGEGTTFTICFKHGRK